MNTVCIGARAYTPQNYNIDYEGIRHQVSRRRTTDSSGQLQLQNVHFRAHLRSPQGARLSTGDATGYRRNYCQLKPLPPSGSCPTLLLLGSHVMAYPQLAKKGRFWIFKIINNAQRHQQQRLAHSESTIFLLMVWHSESGDPEMKLVVVY